LEYKLEVWDSPNSAGVIIDALRCAKIAKDRKIGGALISPSSYLMKSPPVQFDDSVHGEGRYQVGGEELRRLEGEGCVVLRYAANPNGSVGDVAGLSNPGGNVLGLMPHPERACDPQTGGTDGLRLLAAALG
jgi:hypothetical protein